MSAVLDTLGNTKYAVSGTARLTMEGTLTWVYFNLQNVPYDMCTCHGGGCDSPITSRCAVKLVFGAAAD